MNLKKFLVDGLHFSIPFRMWCTIEFGNKNRRTFLWWSNSGKEEILPLVESLYTFSADRENDVLNVLR